MLSSIPFVADLLQASTALTEVVQEAADANIEKLSLAGRLDLIYAWFQSVYEFGAKIVAVVSKERFWTELYKTTLMVFISGFVAIILGTPLGVLQVITDKNGLKPHASLNKVMGAVINIGRSIPFIILIFLLMSVSLLLMGTRIGVKGVLVPLSVSAIPFMARLAEVSLKEVPQGLVEAAQSMGASPMQIIRKVLLPEALPGIVAGITIMLISLIGYSAMAGYVGGGGLGDYAINHGYNRNRWDIIVASVIALVLMVQLTQLVGDAIARKVNHR